MSICALEVATEGSQRHLELNHAEVEVLRRAIDTALQRAAGSAEEGGLVDPTGAAAVAFFCRYKDFCSREMIPFRGGAVALDETDVHALFQAVAHLLQNEGGEKGRRRGRLPATTLLAKLSRGTV